MGDQPVIQFPDDLPTTRLAPPPAVRVVQPVCTACRDHVVAAYGSLMPDSAHRELAWWCPTCQKHIPNFAHIDPEGTLWMLVALTQGRPVQWFRKEPTDAPR